MESVASDIAFSLLTQMFVKDTQCHTKHFEADIVHVDDYDKT